MEKEHKRKESNARIYFINKEKRKYNANNITIRKDEKIKTLGVLNGENLPKIKNLSNTEILGADLSKSAKF